MVYTNHTLEPNGGQEEKALKEMYRITKEYLVLFEPIYEFAGVKSKEHMEKHGYIKGLYGCAKKLGMDVVEYKLLFPENLLSPNNTGVLVIRKKKDECQSHKVDKFLACPVTRSPISKVRDNYYSSDSMLLYPIVDSIPCLLPDNAVVATHYLDFVRK